MTVSPSGTREMFYLKQKLREDGWTLKIADTTLEEQKQFDKKSVTEVSLKQSTDYIVIAAVSISQLLIMTRIKW